MYISVPFFCFSKTCGPSLFIRRCAHFGLEEFQRVSTLFQPVQAIKKADLRDDGVSSRNVELLTGAGYIRQSSSGIFHLLPLCLRVLGKMERAIDAELLAIGANKMAMPTLVRDTLWKQSGRLEKMGAELMSVKERGGHRLVLSPTHEEAITQLVAALSPVSARQLPLRIYQTTSKFRDERRPRFGLLRCKEFLMNDMYTFDAGLEAARETYHQVTDAYRRIFRRLGITVVRVRGDSGVMGGRLSHEFHVLSSAGEDTVWTRPDCEQAFCPAGVNAEVGVDGRADGTHERTCPACAQRVQRRTGIEVGHTFLLGGGYSESFGASTAAAAGASGGRQPLQMGCYGIGVTRLLAAALEASAERGGDQLTWPAPMAPYRLCVIPPKAGSRESGAGEWAWRTVSQLSRHPRLRNDLLVDDRDHLTIGQRLKEARVSGHPSLLVFGKEAVHGRAELIHNGELCLVEDAELVEKVLAIVDGV